MAAAIILAHYQPLSPAIVRSAADSWIPAAAALRGDPASLATLGLLVLTMVPLIRVGFCLLFFLRQRNLLYVAMTGYVLAVLTAGIFLGRIG
jgi:uncharacterized membrane protein